MSKVDKQTAVAEFDKWITAKKLSKNKLEGMQSVADEIISEIEDGSLVLNDNNEWEYDLKFPFENGNNTIKKLVFKPRVTQGRLDARFKKLDAKDVTGRFACIIAELTNEQEGNIKSLDTADASLCNAIASYFF